MSPHPTPLRINRCIQSVNYKEGGVAFGDQPAIPGVGGNGYGYEASEVPEVERKEFVTKVKISMTVERGKKG